MTTQKGVKLLKLHFTQKLWLEQSANAYTEKAHWSNTPSHEPNIQDTQTVHAGIHLLLDRKDWHKHLGWKAAIDKELNGILENQT